MSFLAMPMSLPPFAMMRAFEAFGRTGGVRRAAADLRLSHAIVSRHLKGLEAWLGIMLIDRESGALTAAGHDYHLSVNRALESLSSATVAAMRGAQGRLEIWSVPGFASLWLNGRLASFRQDHPKIALDLRPSETGAELVHLQADADIRFVRDVDARAAAGNVQTLVLARPEFFPVAAPALGEQWGPRLGRLEDLLSAPLLQEEDDGDWRAWFLAQGVDAPVPAPVARLWQAHLALGAAREGQGVALTNAFLAHEDLRSGRLRRLTLGSGGQPSATIGAYVLSARSDRWESPPLTRFRRWLIEACEADLSAF